MGFYWKKPKDGLPDKLDFCLIAQLYRYDGYEFPTPEVVPAYINNDNQWVIMQYGAENKVIPNEQVIAWIYYDTFPWNEIE